MSDITEGAVEDPESHSEAVNASAEGDAPKGNREARYRVERNEARAELTAAQERIEALQTAELHRLAGEHLATGEDISLSGMQLSDFLTPEGWLDRDAVAKAAAAVLADRPGLRRGQPAHDPSQGLGGTLKRPVEEPSWGSLLAESRSNSFGR